MAVHESDLKVISDLHVKSITAAFNSYVKSIYRGDQVFDEAIRMKETHSYRVADESAGIAESLDLSESDVRIATITGVLHDIGRFNQFVKFGNYIDGRSGNHGEMGAEAIISTGILDELDSRSRDIIISSVKCHNRASIPENCSSDKTLHLKLIRDADKIDILKVVTEHYTGKQRYSAIQIELPETGTISNNIMSALSFKRNAKYEDVKTLDDLKLMQIGWVYDINFPETFRILKERNYIEIIRSSLPKNDGITSICDAAQSFVEEKSRGTCASKDI
jgi:hypothetical protein